MARDPVCGTYVVPERAVALNDVSTGAAGRVFFCSTACRDQYRAHGAKTA
jgi:YHS domain-containing protein